MQVIRKIKATDSDRVSLKIPKSFVSRQLEIIIKPIDDVKTPRAASSRWPKDFFAKTAGCFAGTPLAREDQGEYEERDLIA